MTDAIRQRPTSQRGMKGVERFKVWGKKNGSGWGFVGAPADATHDTLSHFMIVRVASLTALILKDYPGEGHYTEHRLAPSSLLLHWIILASSSVISLEHHLCMLFLGYYLQESKYFGEHWPSFTFPAGETQPCWQKKPPSPSLNCGNGVHASSIIDAPTFKAHWNGSEAQTGVTFEGNDSNVTMLKANLTLITAHSLQTIFEMQKTKREIIISVCNCCFGSKWFNCSKMEDWWLSWRNEAVTSQSFMVIKGGPNAVISMRSSRHGKP